jgi:hypothetical protein
MSEKLKIEFIQPNLPLSINKSNQMHWAARRRYLSDWRLNCRLAYTLAMRNKNFPIKPVTIEYTFTFGRKARRDPHNYIATAKALTDELVLLGLVPDDTADWVTVVEPILRVDKDNTCFVNITTRS